MKWGICALRWPGLKATWLPEYWGEQKRLEGVQKYMEISSYLFYRSLWHYWFGESLRRPGLPHMFSTGSLMWVGQDSDLPLNSPGFLKTSLLDNYSIIYRLYWVIHFSVTVPRRSYLLMGPTTWGDSITRAGLLYKIFTWEQTIPLDQGCFSGMVILGTLFRIFNNLSGWSTSIKGKVWLIRVDSTCPQEKPSGLYQDGKMDVFISHQPFRLLS